MFLAIATPPVLGLKQGVLVRRAFSSTVFVGTVLFIAGCGDLIPPRPPLGPPPKQSATDAGMDASPGQLASGQGRVIDAPVEEFVSDWEDWYVHRIGNQVVGLSQVSGQSVIDAELLVSGKADVRFERLERFLFRSGSTQFTRRVMTQSVESQTGDVQRFETEAVTGPVSMKVKGKRAGDMLQVQTVDSGELKTLSLPWSPGHRGLFAIEQTLRRRLIAKGETRKLFGLTPSMKGVGLTELKCTGEASVSMLDGTYQLLSEVEVKLVEGDQVTEELVVWVDEVGVIQKMLRPAMRIETLRASRTTARKSFGQRDDGEVLVSVKGVLRKNAVPRQVAFVIISSELAAKQAEETNEANTSAAMIAPAVGQAIRRVPDGLQVLVSTDQKWPDGFEQFQDWTNDSDTAPTKLIDFEHPSVARMSQALGEVPKGELLNELSHMTKNVLSFLPQGGLRSSSSVIRSGNGGELDHSVVLTSLLRSRGVPTRIALGLKAVAGDASDDRSLMRLGSWVVAYVDGAWVTIDPLTAKLNQADRLCLRQTDGTQDLGTEIVSVFRRISDIEVEIRGARYVEP